MLEPRVITREHYDTGLIGPETYFGQFVNERIKNRIKVKFDWDQLLSGYLIDHANIPPYQFESMNLYILNVVDSELLFAAGDSKNADTAVWIAKVAAKMVVEDFMSQYDDIHKEESQKFWDHVNKTIENLQKQEGNKS